MTAKELIYLLLNYLYVRERATPTVSL